MFISLDGLDGVGKSTQIALLAEWLRAQGRQVLVCRDPGSTALGDEIRALLLDDPARHITRRAEMLLYMAARAQLVEERIVPALEAGGSVICDRFLLANVVYQGYAGGLDVEALWRIGHVATGGVLPQLTFVLDMPEEAAAARLGRPLDRMEQQGDEFRRRVRQGFLTEAARQSDRIVLVRADRPIDEVQSDIRQALRARFNPAVEGAPRG